MPAPDDNDQHDADTFTSVGEVSQLIIDDLRARAKFDRALTKIHDTHRMPGDPELGKRMTREEIWEWFLKDFEARHPDRVDEIRSIGEARLRELRDDLRARTKIEGGYELRRVHDTHRMPNGIDRGGPPITKRVVVGVDTAAPGSDVSVFSVDEEGNMRPMGGYDGMF